MVKSFLRIALVCALALPTAACAAIFGFQDLTADDDDSSFDDDGASPDSATGDTSTVDGGNACTSVGIPAAPTAVTDAGAGTDALAPFVLALSVVNFGAADAGFNLDRTCTSNIATSSCTTTDDEVTFDKYGQDTDNNGTDNASYGLLMQLGMFSDAFQPDGVSSRLAAGEFGFVFRVSSWNGLPEDDSVSVEVFPAVGVPVDPNASPLMPGGTPKFDSTDLWLRDQRFQQVATIDVSSLESAKAYVTGGRLVASFGELTLPISVPNDPKPLDIEIQEALVVGDLVSDTVGYKLANGVIAGRWRTVDLLDQVRQVYIDNTMNIVHQDLCDPGNPAAAYAALKTEICQGRDLRGSSADDNMALPCNAVSSAVRFDSYGLADAGPYYTRPAIPARCTADGSVEAGDDCPAP